MKTQFKKPLYYAIGLGVLLLLAGVVTYPLKTAVQSEKTVNKPKQKLERIVSPAGIGRFIRIDSLDKKYREEGEYTISLELPNTEETQEYLNKISGIIENFKKSEEQRLGRELRMAKLPWRVIPVNKEEEETERLTGEKLSNDEVFLLKYRELGSFRHKGEKIYTKIFRFDSNNKPYKGPIPPDSLIKVSADVIPFNNVYGVGATLRLKAVQLLELGASQDKLIPESFGFISEKWSETEEPKPEEDPQLTDPVQDNSEAPSEPQTR
jgi:hypothetical protein